MLQTLCFLKFTSFFRDSGERWAEEIARLGCAGLNFFFLSRRDTCGAHDKAHSLSRKCRSLFLPRSTRFTV